MTSNLYVIFDKLAELSGPIFEAPTDGIAIRQTANTLDPSAIDLTEYQLLHVGYLNKTTGQITPTEIVAELDFISYINRHKEEANV